MRSLEFENDDLFNEPGQVYRRTAADINEYSNPLGDFRVSNIEYEELHSAIADALSYNWTDDQYEELLTPLYRTVDEPLADFFDNVLNDNPRAESDRFVDQLVSILQSNYQRYGTEPRAAVDGVTRALERGYSLAQNMWGNDVEIDESDDDLFEPRTGLKFYHNPSPEYEQLYGQLVPAQGPASTLEGELLRAASRLYYQYVNNGFGNNVSGAENFIRQFAELTPAMQRALHTIHPYTRGDIQDLENKQTAHQVEIALDIILQGVIRQVQAANGRYHPNTNDKYDMFDYEDPDDDVEPEDDYDGYEEPDYDEDDEDLAESNDDLFEPSQRVKILHAVRGMRRGGDINGTSLQGTVRTTYAQLLQTFGKPMFGPDERDYDKVTCEWVITFGDDSVATIYDWKTRYTPRGEYDWHIGGHRKVVAEYVRVALELGRDAVVTEDDDDDLFEPRAGYIPLDVVAKIMPGVETFMRYLEDDTDMKEIRKQDPENYRTIIRDFQGAAQELKRGNVIKALAYIENSPQFFDLDDWFLTIILRRTGIDLSDYYDSEDDRLNNLFRKYQAEIKALREYGMSGFQETKMKEVREFVEWTRNVVTEDQDDDLFEPTTSPTLLKLYKELDEVCEYAQEQGYQHYGVFEMMLRSSQTWEEIYERLGGEYHTTERDIIKAATAEERQELIEDMTYYLSSLRDELDLTESDRKKKTQTKTDQPGLDPNMFTPKPDQPLARQEPPQDQKTDQPRDIRRASAARTRQATAGITPTDQMRDMLGRLRNIEIDPNLEPYPTDDPTREISVDVNTQNLPAVAGANMQAAGIQNPEFYQVAALPGNMAAMIRQLGKSLFASMTATPTNNIYVVANLGGQGPNTTQEVNAVAGYLRDHAVNIGPGDIDFSKIMPGYSAETNMFSAGGIRWLLVRDFAGQYIYAWPEADSVDYGQEPKKLK